MSSIHGTYHSQNAIGTTVVFTRLHYALLLSYRALISRSSKSPGLSSPEKGYTHDSSQKRGPAPRDVLAQADNPAMVHASLYEEG